MVQALHEHNRALQEQLHQTSRNSSRPPSSDPPHSERPHRPGSKRRRGGQPGHPGHTRPLLPVEEVDEVVVIKPEQCTYCQAPLAGDAPKPWRHQVIEIPPITPVVTEYQWHQLVCATCGEVTRAPWPAGVPSGTYGPRGNRSGCENVTLAIISPHGVPCRHGNTACIITRGVGTDPTRSASLYSGTRSACGDFRRHDGGVARTPDPDLAELLTPTIK
jgi:Family of unknown function (DUF6444)/zinc-finger binding domain of transposase IS66